jgi:hypothetical protein
MKPEQLLIKIKALDLLIDEVLIDITNDDALAAMDESCEADRQTPYRQGADINCLPDSHTAPHRL